MDGPGDTKKANKLAEEYKSNEEKINAESIVIEALGETTEPGEILTRVREHVISRYGPEHAKDASETYSKAIEVIKQVKESLGGEKSDVMTYKVMTILTADVLRLQISNTWIETRVNYLDTNVYNKMTHQVSNHTLFSGGGAGGSWK